MQNAIIGIYLFVILIVGLKAGQNIKGMKEYAVAGKSFGTLAIFATLSASFIGGGFSMGNAEKVFLVGISNIVALWGFSLKEILVAKYIAPNMQHYEHAISVGDIMEPAYGKEARIFSGVFGFILCAGILGAQIGAIGYIFNLFLGIDKTYGILIGMSIVIIYATIGGMKAVVWTDIIQFIVLAVGMPLVLYFGLESIGGWKVLEATVPEAHLTLPTDFNSIVVLISLFLTFLLGETLVPPYLQRLLIGKEIKKVSRGTLLSGIFSVPFFAMTGFIGLIALAMNPELNANLAMPYVIQNSLNPLLQGIVIAAIISIIMSSADSFLNSAAIAFSNDLIKPIKKVPLTIEAELKMARYITLFVGLIAVIFALSIDSVLDILIYSYNFWAPTVLVPLASALLGLKVSRLRFLAGSTAGILGVVVWNYLLSSPLGIDGLVVGTLCNFIVFFLVDTKGAKQQRVQTN